MEINHKKKKYLLFIKMDIIDKDIIEQFNLDMKKMDELKKSAVGKKFRPQKTAEERKAQTEWCKKKGKEKRKKALE
jgi:hypothetical protein